MKKTKRADRRKYHYIYETICLVSHRFYIGMHSTDNLQDGYCGSGTYLWRSIKKYGKDKHVTKILEFLPDRKSLKTREKEVINEELIGNKMCMNLALGGEGGKTYEPNDKHIKVRSENCKKLVKEQARLRKSNPEWAKKESLRRSKVSKQAVREGKINLSFASKKHKQSTKEKMSQAKKGKYTGTRNSQYGTCWIYNLELQQSKKINKEKLNIYLRHGWLKGRKLKF